MNSELHPAQEHGQDDLRGFHMQYWRVSQEDEATFPKRNYEEFVVFFTALEGRKQTEYVEELRKRFEQCMAKDVSEGVKVIEKYSFPES